MSINKEFFIHVSEQEKHLVITRTENIKSTALSPCCMTPGDVDYEMAKGKNPEMLEICSMEQQSLEYFVQHYGKSYRYLSFFKCQLIQDFSPLADLPNLEEVNIYWNIRADKLWDMSRNQKLQAIQINDCKKIIHYPQPLTTSPTLKTLRIGGSIFNNTPMASLNWAAGMPALERLDLHCIKLEDKDVSVLDTLPNLRHFDFDPGMLTREEIAWIVAKYPQLEGEYLKAYTESTCGEVRISGFRKPSFWLPEGQKRLDKYIAEFDALVEKYRQEMI